MTPQRASEHRPSGDSWFGRYPVYPVAFAVALVFAVFTNSQSAVEVLPRPLLVATLLAGLVTVVLMLVTRDRHVGAFAAFAIVLTTFGWRHVALIAVSVPVSVLLAGLVVRRTRPAFPWARASELLNLIGGILVVLSLYSAWSQGALNPFGGGRAGEPLGGSSRDIYLILLDGYPRLDTLQDDFGYDNGPFLKQLESVGFEVASNAHSNYQLTLLTLASMFNMSQVPDIPALATWPPRPQEQSRAISRAINDASGLRTFRRLGYEIVTIPSPWSPVTLYSADRVMDDGTITDFELSMLGQGIIPDLLSEQQTTWMTDQLRSRIATSLDRTVELARERGGAPKLVFTHLLTPHTPVLFDSDGSPRRGWPCLPHCSVFDLGWRYTDEEITPVVVGQVEYLNLQIERMVRDIISESEEAPIIVLFSDHGLRHQEDDRDEMFRSFVAAFTPDHVGLIPDDASLVNILPRLLNAYHDQRIPMASEESYWTDLVTLRFDQMSPYEVAERSP